MTRRSTTITAAALLAGATLVAVAPAADALTDRWAQWAPVTGTANNYATAMQQRSAGFPRAAVSSDSRGNVQLATSATLTGGTPPGAKYGTSAGSSYLILRPKADTPTTPSRTTYTFDHPTPDTGWAFVLGDIDADEVKVAATDEDGDPVPASTVDGWFQGSFNYAGGADRPSWNGATSTLTGNPAALDTNGASGWFEPDVRLTSLTMTFTRRAGLPVYQTWFVSRARPIGGVVSDVSPSGSCPVQDSVLTLASPWGEELATTSPAADGSYAFPEHATQSGYVVRLARPTGCAVVGAAELTVSNRGNDNDAASRADFDVRREIPQPISGTVRDSTGAPVAGATLTLTRPGGGTTTTTTAEDGTYLFDDNPLGGGYQVALTVPEGYVASTPTTIAGLIVASSPITGQDFVVRALPSVSGTVTGGGHGLGGVQVVLTPAGGGAPVTTVTRGDGTYEVPAVPAGGYTISASPPDGYAAATDRTVTVAGTDLTGQDFAFTRPGATGGTVLDDAGAPQAGVTITVDGPGAPTTTTTDTDGSWFVDGLPAGTYTARVTPPAGYAVDGPATRTAVITDAGEVVGGRDFTVVAESVASPSPSPSATPASPSSPAASAAPSSAPAAPPSGAGGSDGLPDTGGPPALMAATGVGLVGAGLVLLLVGARRRPAPSATGRGDLRRP